jgi:hypothetical protein
VGGALLKCVVVKGVSSLGWLRWFDEFDVFDVHEIICCTIPYLVVPSCTYQLVI